MRAGDAELYLNFEFIKNNLDNFLKLFFLI